MKPSRALLGIERVAASIAENYPLSSIELLEAVTVLEPIAQAAEAANADRLALAAHWAEHNA